MPDRSPEPADKRVWTIGRAVRNGLHHHPTIEGSPWPPVDAPVVVVPKSRLDAAMAAADERERELERKLAAIARDRASAVRWVEREKREAEDALTEALREARDVASKGHAATEHLRDCDLAGTHDADAAIVLDFLNAHDALFRKPLLVPVEGPTASQIAEREGIGNDSLRRLTARKLAESDGRTDAD